MKNYARHFSDDAFWNKLSRSAGSAGRRVVETALVLYYCLRDPDTPTKVRAVIIGALGYLIFPLDAIPDFIPGVGFTDDLAGLVAALTALMMYVKPKHRAQARAKVREWFPVEQE
jgi:uncharacterized membrane protein YkvA (DUF1232 family)